MSTDVIVYENVQDLEQKRFLPVMSMGTALDRRQVIVEATQKLMKDGVDYGKIPGSDRPSLLQPGADKLCNLFGLVIKYEVIEQIKDWTGEHHGGEPFFYVEVKGRAYRGDVCMGEGVGSCSSWESKYRWRKSERKCPTCGKENIRSSKQDGGWYCWKKTDGCGATFQKGDPAIESQEVGRKPNPDVYDQINTIQKMAYKRCKVSTTINATSASEFFTQDMEDFSPNNGEERGSQAAADAVAQRKIAELKELEAKAKLPMKDEISANMSTEKRKKPFDRFAFLDAIKALKKRYEALEQVDDYYEILGEFSVAHSNEIKDPGQAVVCYKRMSLDIADREAAAQAQQVVEDVQVQDEPADALFPAEPVPTEYDPAEVPPTRGRRRNASP